MVSAFKKDELVSGTGARLNLLSMRPSGPPKAVVQVNHGMAEHAARYERFATAFTNAGYAVYAHDHRGHGATKAHDAPLGEFGNDGIDAVLADADAVNSHIRKLHKETPVIVFGHSMGAIISLNYAMRNPGSIDACVVWNAGFDTGALLAVYGILLRLEKLFKGSSSKSFFAKKLTFDTWNQEFKPNRTGFDWLSRDPIEVDKYIADPLCGFDVSIALWLEVLNAVRMGADDARLTSLPKSLPIHLLGGSVDPCSDKGKALQNLKERLEKSGLSDVTLSILPETRHESLNEVNRDQTTADFIAWLNSKF